MHYRRSRTLCLIVLALLAVQYACKKAQENTPPLSPQEQLVLRGRAVFAANCTACHNSDPRKPGSIGPDLYGSPRALIEARVLSASYPPGYTPKRTTHVMPKLPQLKGEVDALAAFLGAGR